MFKKIFSVLIVLFFISALPIFAEEEEENQIKKYDFRFSLAGGNIGGSFALTGEFLYAREFGQGYGFFQTSGFANVNKDVKEYGGSLGLGANTDEGFSFYLFADSLYSHEKLWIQLRPTIRLRFSWFGLMGFYAIPITHDTIQINSEDVGAGKYLGGEVEIVPVDWARAYGNLMSIENSYTRYSIGAEVRLLKWLSLSADWNKTDPGFYSNWNSYKDFRVALNILFGAQQQSFKPTHKKHVTPFYPILVVKEEKSEPPPPPTEGEIEFKYERVFPIIDHNADLTRGALSIWHPVYKGRNSSHWVLIEKGKWMASAHLKYHAKPYFGSVNDYAVNGEPIAVKLFARVKGDANWIELTNIVTDPSYPKGKSAKFVFNHGRIQIPS